MRPHAVALLCLLFASSVWAGDVRLLAADIVPYAYESHGRVVGVSVDLVREMALRQGQHIDVELVPYVRAYETMVKADPAKTLMVQVARTPAREKDFSWLVPMFHEPFMVFVRPGGHVDTDIVAHAHHGPVGVLHGGIGEALAQELNIGELEEAPDELTNARKLMAGHLDAWVASLNSARGAMRDAGFRLASLARGPVLRVYAFYLVAPPGYPPTQMSQWIETLEAMRRDGTYQRILARYDYLQ